MEALLGELIAIEHKFLRFVSRLTPFSMRFDDHDYTQVRSHLGLIPLRATLSKNDYILAYKITHRLINSSEVSNLFTERSLTYNLRNPRPLESFGSGFNYINYSTTSRLRHFWNFLPLELRNSTTLAIFKNRVHRYLTL